VADGSPEETRGAVRRTRLANERTYLAWWRTGLTALAVGLAAGRLVPELSGGANWQYEVIGVAFALVGVALFGYGYVRQNAVDVALSRGDYAPLPGRVALVFACLGVLLGIATLVVVLAHPS
jgi:putative membrane protein